MKNRIGPRRSLWSGGEWRVLVWPFDETHHLDIVTTTSSGKQGGSIKNVGDSPVCTITSRRLLHGSSLRSVIRHFLSQVYNKA